MHCFRMIRSDDTVLQGMPEVYYNHPGATPDFFIAAQFKDVFYMIVMAQ